MYDEALAKSAEYFEKVAEKPSRLIGTTPESTVAQRYDALYIQHALTDQVANFPWPTGPGGRSMDDTLRDKTYAPDWESRFDESDAMILGFAEEVVLQALGKTHAAPLLSANGVPSGNGESPTAPPAPAAAASSSVAAPPAAAAAASSSTASDSQSATPAVEMIDNPLVYAALKRSALAKFDSGKVDTRTPEQWKETGLELGRIGMLQGFSNGLPVSLGRRDRLCRQRFVLMFSSLTLFCLRLRWTWQPAPRSLASSSNSTRQQFPWSRL